LRQAVEKKASDIFIGAGRRVSFKIDGAIVPQAEEVAKPDIVREYVTELYGLAKKPMERFLKAGDDDFPVTVPGLARFRASAYMQRGTMAAVIRVVPFGIPDYRELNIPEEVMGIAEEKNGLVLVTGPAGSGKTTTLACIIDAVNKTRNCHIITLEDPIEYLHRDMRSLVSQREIAADTESYVQALRACLRQAPDIILLGEMRDLETIQIAMTAAETGHLVISTLHTVGAVNTLNRVIDVFPPEQQHQMRVQLSMVLRKVVSQSLLVGSGGGQLPAFEIMNLNSGIRSLIRESKTHQIGNVIQTSEKEGMVGMDSYILKLFAKGAITRQTALDYAMNTEFMARRLASQKDPA
jgi:twitching motility protein PilT